MKNIITDYSATGNGVASDTVAFQAAASGYPVLIPYTTGGYVVDDAVILSEGTSIKSLTGPGTI